MVLITEGHHGLDMVSSSMNDGVTFLFTQHETIRGHFRAIYGSRHMPTAACRYIPFSGGPRKCVGDQFAMMEAIIAMAVALKKFEFRLTPGQDIQMTTGATIHTTNGLYMNVKPRGGQSPKPQQIGDRQPVAIA